MDYFESIAKTLLEDDGYWVRQSFKVDLTTEQKRQIAAEKWSIPRPEIDLLAFKASLNEVIVFEVKSYFDSGGTKLKELAEQHDIPQGRYKLFTCLNYQHIVLKQLRADLLASGLIDVETKLKLGLIIGNVRKSDLDGIKALCEQNKWVFWAPDEIRDRVAKLANKGYENEPAVITAKILMR